MDGQSCIRLVTCHQFGLFWLHNLLWIYLHAGKGSYVVYNIASYSTEVAYVGARAAATTARCCSHYPKDVTLASRNHRHLATMCISRNNIYTVEKPTPYSYSRLSPRTVALRSNATSYGSTKHHQKRGGVFFLQKYHLLISTE